MLTIATLIFATLLFDARGADRHRPRLPLLERISDRTLERASLRAVRHHRILSTRWGDATPWLRNVARELVERAFIGDNRRWALCVVERESGFNPGAISATDDHGLAQIHRTAHPWINVNRARVDPPYAVRTFVALSDHGRNRSPWNGGNYVC